MQARRKIIEAIRRLPKEASRKAWAQKLGPVLYEKAKGKK